MKKITLILALSLGGCVAADRELVRNPATGTSALEDQIKAAQPVLGPYGSLAVILGGLVTTVYGAFRSHRADVQTDQPKV